MRDVELRSEDQAATTDARERPAAVMSGKVRVPQLDALPRPRLHASLARAWQHRLGLVVAPAGSGKTSLLASFAAGLGCPVAWYRAESWDGDEETFLLHLQAAIVRAVPEIGGQWRSIESALDALEHVSSPRALLVIDDLHELEGSRAEASLGRLIENRPPWLAIVIASRTEPRFNVSRLRVSNGVLDIGADDLRFRSWEVEQLFRDFYREPAPPEELAVLARRTEGWAAGLQLFHLATRYKTGDERRRLLAGGGRSTRIMHEYLTQNVLDALDADLREFVVETSVLGRLSGRLCDDLLGRAGSRRLLEQLEDRGIFMVRLDDEGTYRYHEAFRGHLQGILVDRVGESGVRDRCERAAQLLEAAGAAPEALAAYVRADDEDAVRRLLRREGATIAADSGGWFDNLPNAMTRHDPWLILAAARRARGEGRWRTAISSYERAEEMFSHSSQAAACRRERNELASWLDPGPAPATGWSGILRAAMTRDAWLGAREASQLPEEHRRLTSGLVMLLVGQVRDARQLLTDAADQPDASPLLGSAARLGQAVAEALAGDARAVLTLERAVAHADVSGSTWLGRVARAVAMGLQAAFDIDTDGDVGGFEQGDIGQALEALARAWGARRPDVRLDAATRAAAMLHGRGMDVLEAWARALGALASADLDPGSGAAAATSAEWFARSTGTLGARLYACLALEAASEGAAAADYHRLADAIGNDTGLASPPRPVQAGPATAAPPRDSEPDGLPAGKNANPARTGSPLQIRCLGPFVMLIGSVPMETTRLRPRARSLLRFLVLNVGKQVHKESMVEALWPDTDPEAAVRSLQVAVSSIRGLLKDAGIARSCQIVRDGDAYALIADSWHIDFVELDRAVDQASSPRHRDGNHDVRDELRRALDAYGGELMADEGPAEWLLEAREHARATAVKAALILAETALLDGDLETAEHACQRGLEVDRYQDSLWRMLIRAREGAGHAGAALKARHDYQSILVKLEVADQMFDVAARD